MGRKQKCFINRYMRYIRFDSIPSLNNSFCETYNKDLNSEIYLH